jgi:hypothetical protein
MSHSLEATPHHGRASSLSELETPTPTTKEKNHKAEIGPRCKEGMWKLPSSEKRSFSLTLFFGFHSLFS